MASTSGTSTPPVALPRVLLVSLARANLVLAASVAASSWMVQALAGLPPDPVPPAVSFLVMYAVYSLDRAAEPEADLRTHPERARFARRHARRMRLSALGAYALALLAASTHGGDTVAAALLPLAVVLPYSFPFLPARVARRVGFARLKEVLVLKNAVVAFTLAATPVLLALSAAEGVPGRGPALAVGAFLFGRWCVNTVFFDVRDETGDRENGVRTIPVAIGRRATLRALHALNALLAALALSAPLLGWAPARFALLAASSVYAWAYLRRFAAGGDPHFLCDVVSDGELLVLAAIVLAAGASPG